MTHKFNILRHGEPSDIYNVLDDQPCDEGELRAALQRAFQLIEVQQRLITRLESRVDFLSNRVAGVSL